MIVRVKTFMPDSTEVAVESSDGLTVRVWVDIDGFAFLSVEHNGKLLKKFQIDEEFDTREFEV